MNVYVCYFGDYDELSLKKVVATEEEAIVWCAVNGDLAEYTAMPVEKFDFSKYNLFEYYKIVYDSNRKQVVKTVSKEVGVKGITKIKFNKLKDSNNIYEREVYFTTASSFDEALEKFYEDYKNYMDAYYYDNNIRKQTGELKTWKNKDDRSSIDFINYADKLKGTQK